MGVYSLKEEVIKHGKTVRSTHAMKGGKIMIEDLKHKFDNLGDEEKIEFMKLIMPSFRDIFMKNPVQVRRIIQSTEGYNFLLENSRF
jgi:hypothetical protein